MSDYSFMRSGFDNLVQAEPTLSKEEQANIMGLLMIFMENAARDASQYASAASRSIVLPKDIVLALKRQAVPSGGFWNDPNLLQRFAENRQAMLADDDDDEDDDDDDESSEGEGDDAASVPQWTAAPSDASELCAGINAAEAEFAAWGPTTPMESIVRRAIVEVEEQFLAMDED